MRHAPRLSLLGLTLVMTAACGVDPPMTRSRGSSAVAFEVVERKDTSHALARTATVRVMMNVSELPLLREIKEVARLVQQEQVERWDELIVFIYLPGMDVHGAAYGISELTNDGQETCETHDDALFFTPFYAQTPRGRQLAIEEEKNLALQQVTAKDGKVVSYEMSLVLDLTGEDGGHLRVQCDTDLPDDTMISLVVGREYGMTGADASDSAYAEYYLDEDLTISDGQVVALVQLDDHTWQKTVENHAKKMLSLGLDLHMGGISDDVFVRALYTSHNRDHPPHVVQVLGANGQFVGGPNSDRAGKGRTLSAEGTVLCKFRR